jgi:hypothetical protein
LKAFIDVLFVQGEELRLLLYNMQRRVLSSSLKPSLVLTQLEEVFKRKSSLNSPVRFIKCEDIQANGYELQYFNQKIKLQLLKSHKNSPGGNHLMFILQLSAPKLSALPSFQHIQGYCELKSSQWGYEPGLYRVEWDLPAINKAILSPAQAIYVLFLAGKALISLHAKNHRCLCLSPSSIALYEQQIVFLQCAMHSCTLPMCLSEQVDIRFLAPEVVEAYTGPANDANITQAADYYSFALLIYALLINPAVHEDCPKPLVYTADNLKSMQEMRRKGARPLIPSQFEEDYPETASVVRMGLESAELRPTIQEMMEKLKREGNVDDIFYER